MQAPKIPQKIEDKIQVECAESPDNENLQHIRMTFFDLPQKFSNVFVYEMKAMLAFRFCSKEETEKLNKFFTCLYRKHRKKLH